MKKLGYYLTLMVVMILASCSKDNSADVNSLLATVPSSSSMVTVLNVESMLRNAGAKLEDGKVVFPKEIQAKIDASKNKRDSEFISHLVSGEAGVAPTVAVIFSDGLVVYMTGRLSDTGKFTAAVEHNTGEKFSVKNGVKVCGKVAVNDDQFWMILSGRGEIDPVEVKGYTALSEQQSFLNNKVSEDLSGYDKDILGWVNISGLMNLGEVDFQQRAISQVVLSTIFDDAESLMFSTAFEKGEMETIVKVLNGKGKPAKCLLSFGKIDESTLLKLAGPAEAIMAANIPAKMIDEMTQQTAGNASVLNIVLQKMQGVDGTMALVYGENMKTFRGVITTDGDNLTDIINMVTGPQIMTERKGNQLFFRHGTPDGTSTVSKLSAPLKDSSLGMSGVSKKLKKQGIDSYLILFNTSAGSMEVKIELKSDNDKVNILQTMLEHVD